VIVASLRRYDVQAKLSLYVSCAAALCVLGLLAILVRNYNSQFQTISYGAKSIYRPLVFASGAMAMLLACAGGVMGAVSAGQKRNTFSKRSWIAFFLGGLTFSLTVVLLYAFLLLGFATG